MAKGDWSRAILVILVTAVVACNKPVTEEEPDLSSTQELLPTQTTPIDQIATATSSQNTIQDPTYPPPPIPTALPTTDQFANWQQIGSDTTGIQLLAPPTWINVTNQIDTPTSANEIGLMTLLSADTIRTGDSLLGRKAIGDGAYVAGFVANHEFPPNTPQSALTQLLANLQKNVTPLDAPTAITAFTANGGRVSGAYIDVIGEPFIFPNNSNEQIISRLVLFTSALGGALNNNTQAIFLFSAPESSWPTFQPVFDDIVKTVIIHNLYADFVLQDGAANVLGALGEIDLVSSSLRSGVKDVWTFRIDEPRYANLTISPDNKDIDLTLTLISPSGETITRMDNGFAGDKETLADQLLTETGLYIIEISEFFNEPGRYTLSLSLSDEPLYGGGGQLAVGQTIEGMLIDNGQQAWTFNGNAGSLVSIVLMPEEPFDVLLDLFGPDGVQLVALDEGFSGDAEVVSGLALPLSGPYTILVRSFAGDGGRFSLSVDEGGESTANFYDAGDLSYGESRQEQLQPNEAHAWFFMGQAGDEVMVDVLPLDAPLDLDVWLLDPDVNRLTAVDDFLAGQPEHIVFTLPTEGQYLILVRDFFGESGRYEIKLMAMPVAVPDDAGMVTVGTAVSGILAPQQTIRWYFEAAQGETLSFLLEPGNPQLDLLFTLYDPAGNRVHEMDNGGTGTDESLLNYRITSNGRWSIVLDEFYDSSAPYTLTISK